MKDINAGGRDLQREMEVVFFRLHSKLAHLTHRMIPSFLLKLLEFGLLLQGVVLFSVLVMFHYQYVTRVEESCFTKELNSILLGQNLTTKSIDILKIQVSGLWGKLEQDNRKISAEKVAQSTDFFVANNLISVWLHDPVYLYTKDRGFLMLDETIKKKHNIQEVNIKFETSKCFHDNSDWQRYVFDNFIGYDTLMLNSMGSIFQSEGILFSEHSREIFHLSRTRKVATVGVVAKLYAIFLTMFLFFITTTLVHHTMRETQYRVLRFSLDLQMYLKKGTAYSNLMFNHLIGSLVFIPIMVGMLFFLYEFFNDQLLSFMVLAIVWTCELFAAVAMRTSFNLQNFPRLFFVYFCTFHIYYFSYPSGFSYMSLTTSVLLMQHAMLHMFVRYEMPALFNKSINENHLRDASEDLLPEEIQAGGASLAIRVMLSSYHNSKSNNEPTTSSSSSSSSSSTTTTTTSKQQQETISQINEKAIESNASKIIDATENANNGEESFIARPAKKKRTTIHAENMLLDPTKTSTSTQTEAAVTKTWVDEDDSSSTGWEIGGGANE